MLQSPSISLRLTLSSEGELGDISDALEEAEVEVEASDALPKDVVL